MGLLDLFSKKAKAQPPQEGEEKNRELAFYSGMQVEVTTDTGRLLFVAKLLVPPGKKAELHPYAVEAETAEKAAGEVEAVHVRIRGYSDDERKAVYMEGDITPGPKQIWQVEELTVVHTGNDRAFFRLETMLDATATMFSGLGIGEKSCKLLNISVGGACVGSEYRYHIGDKFLLKVKLLEDRPELAVFTQVVRVIEKDGKGFQYGCRFLGLSETHQAQITQNIFAAQRKKAGHALGR